MKEKHFLALTILFNLKSTDYMFMFLLNMSQKLKPAANEVCFMHRAHASVQTFIRSIPASECICHQI